MTDIQIIAFIVAPLALLVIGWAAALIIDWRARHARNHSRVTWY